MILNICCRNLNHKGRFIIKTNFTYSGLSNTFCCPQMKQSGQALSWIMKSLEQNKMAATGVARPLMPDIEKEKQEGWILNVC